MPQTQPPVATADSRRGSNSSMDDDSSWVQPAAPVKPETIRLSPLDGLTARVYPSPTVFFPLQPGVDPRQLYQDCRRGLARYLYEQPYMAGRFIVEDSGRMLIDLPSAPHAGVRLEYHDHRDDANIPSYKDFERHGWPVADGDQDSLAKLRPNPFPAAQHGDPLVAPQFNVIRGGIVLTLSLAHSMCDLVQCMNWGGSWARHTAAVSTARINNQDEPPLPKQIAFSLTDRSIMTPSVGIENDIDKLAARSAKFSQWTLFDPRDPDKIAEMAENLFARARLTHEDLASSSEDELRELSVSVWRFPPASLNRLKNMAQKHAPEGFRLSTVDCLTAFVWLRFFAAKHALGEPGPKPAPTTTRMVYAGSVRHRLTPPLPNNYMPTCVDLFPVTATESDFACPGPEALAKFAVLIRRSNQDWNEDVFWEMLEIAQMHPLSPGLTPAGPLDTLVTDHTRASQDLIENWGPGLGQPVGYREPYLGRVPPHGEITLLPRREGGDIEVMFAGEIVALRRMVHDADLKAVARCEFVGHDFVQTMAKERRRVSKL